MPLTSAAQGLILQPPGDATLTNIIVGSGVAPDGSKSLTTDVYIVKSDGSQIRKITAFNEASQAPGATAVAISPDGTRAGYIAVPAAGGNQEVHSFDIASGTDRTIAVNRQTCPSVNSSQDGTCLSVLSFSQDGAKLIWQSTTYTYHPVPTASYTSTVSAIDVGNFDGSGVQTLSFASASLSDASLSGSANVTTTGGRLIFTASCGDFCDELDTANLDGTGVTTLLQEPNVVFGDVGDPVISVDGSAFAYISFYSSPGHLTPMAAINVSGATCMNAGSGSYYAPAYLTISGNGSEVAWVESGQIHTCSGNFPPFAASNAFDVLLSGDGSRLLYSAGPTGGQRAAVWISDVNGGNAHPVFAPPSLVSAGVVGLGTAAGNPLPLSPGSYFTIYGYNLANADAVVTASAVPFANTLAGVSVQVNGTPVPVQAVTPWQINAVLPQNFPAGTATVTAGLANGTQIAQTATIATSAAAVITYPFQFTASPMLGAAAFHAGTMILADFLNPASPGETLETYGFGLGPTNPAVAAGSAAPVSPLAMASAPAVSIGPEFAKVTFAGLVPGLVGLYQVNVVVPADLAPGLYTLHWATLDPASGPVGYISVK